MQKDITSLEALKDEAREFVARLIPSRDRATLITLSGELGAGKTAFTKELARALGATDEVTSPTFVLLKEYGIQNEHFTTLIHSDAYRLQDEKEIQTLLLEEYVKNPKNIIVIEWPERVQGTLPFVDRALSFFVKEDGTRTLSYEAK